MSNWRIASPVDPHQEADVIDVAQIISDECSVAGHTSNVLLYSQDPGYPQFPHFLTLLNSDLLTLSDNEDSITIIMPNYIHKARRKNLSVTILSALL